MASDLSNKPFVTFHPSVNNKKRLKKKSQGRAINTQEKLCLTCECYEYSSEYKPRNKLAFWEMIWKILQDQIDYDFKKLKNIVLC